MKASQSLRRPSNWQDFESLCKKLWGEIWNCPEIKKNGRLGSDQNGVDIYGTPQGSSDIIGIQCKGKDEYTHKQFTKSEIINEINKAKTFKPPLDKFYLTTTAVKDSKIEQFIREKNLEHKKQGIFGVEIFSWEDIVDLIDENKRTHDWYVKSENYRTNKKISVTFEEGSTNIICAPKFRKTITNYRQKIIPAVGAFSPNRLLENIR